MTRDQIVKRIWLAAGYIGILLIVTLSLIPATARPHTGAGGGFEHAAAYALVGFAFGWGYRQLRPQLCSGIALTATAATLEALQNFVPGRNPEVLGFLSSTSGAWIGLLGAILLSSLVAWGSRKKLPEVGSD